METSSANALTTDTLTADVLVVGGGAGATAAALQAARRNADLRVVLVSELPWLGGMLTSAGVSAPDGNELAAFQTGIWGAFLKELRRRHSGGLDNGWVSFFTYSPAVGAQIFADWVAALPNLQWIAGQKAREVLRASPDAIAGVRFDTVTVKAKITLDGTELGDLLALGDVPYRWGWETQSVWQEPSAPVSLTDPADPLYAITQRYPVQSPTWVVVMQDYGIQNDGIQNDNQTAPVIDEPPVCSPDSAFEGAWANYGDSDTPGGETCLNYGRLPNGQLMINWPHHGNDYGVGLHRLIESDEARAQYGQEARWHSHSFARYIQRQLGRRYGLAQDLFPQTEHSPGGAFALMPYYRESRRVIGLQTVSENDILPMPGAQVAALPMNAQGEMSAIAYGNYPNDHHYPGYEMPLAPKSVRWGGRMTGTPFTIPYEALVPKAVDGLLMCEKNISASHIANGATRLQPVVLGIGQAAGMAAAVCVENSYQPRDLSEKNALHILQHALISDPFAPSALVPLFDLSPEHPQWFSIQKHYLTHPETYANSGYHVSKEIKKPTDSWIYSSADNSISVKGRFYAYADGRYEIVQKMDKKLPSRMSLVTIRSENTEMFVQILNGQQVDILGVWNSAGKWLLCEQIDLL